MQKYGEICGSMRSMRKQFQNFPDNRNFSVAFLYLQRHFPGSGLSTDFMRKHAGIYKRACGACENNSRIFRIFFFIPVPATTLSRVRTYQVVDANRISTMSSDSLLIAPTCVKCLAVNFFSRKFSPPTRESTNVAEHGASIKVQSQIRLMRRSWRCHPRCLMVRCDDFSSPHPPHLDIFNFNSVIWQFREKISHISPKRTLTFWVASERRTCTHDENLCFFAFHLFLVLLISRRRPTLCDILRASSSLQSLPTTQWSHSSRNMLRSFFHLSHGTFDFVSWRVE